MKFKNQNVVITGVNRGLGKYTFERFLKEGANIICTVRKKNKLFANYIKNIKKKHKGKIIILQFDFEKSDQIINELNKLKKRNIKIDILINNVGYASGSILEMTSMTNLEKIFKINFFSQLIIIQKLLPILKKNKKSSIINVCSISSFLDHRGTIGYGSSKAAFAFATKVMAKEFLRYNIRVNAIAPSAFKTDMFNKMDKTSKKKLLKDSKLKRPLSIKSVADKILFLSSSASNKINGKIIKKF